MPAGSRRIRQQWSVLQVLYRILDACSILGGLWIAGRWASAPAEEGVWIAGTMAVIGYYLIAEISGLYRSWRGVSTELEMICALATWGFTLAALASLGYAAGRFDLVGRPVLLAWIAAAPAAILVHRSVLRGVQRLLRLRGINTRRYAIVGVNELGFELARNIEHCEEMGLQLAGFYDDRPAERLPAIPAELGRRLGDLEELFEQARSRQVDMVYITFPMRAEQRIKRTLERLSDTTVSVYLVPDFFVFELLHSRWTSISGLPVVSVFENPFYGVDGLVKRLADLCLACVFLLLAAAPMLVIAVLIKLSSPGPVFFRQRRYGLDGREIRVWKFRTMRVCEDGPEVVQARRGDPRVTRIGAFLRRTSLDELPQLFNVLQGSMSLVGPRPHASVHNEMFRKMIPGYMLRHKVKPGMTGLAQVNGARGETDTLSKMERRIEYDHRYIREWSLWMDVKILCKTVVVVLSGQNAC